MTRRKWIECSCVYKYLKTMMKLHKSSSISLECGEQAKQQAHFSKIVHSFTNIWINSLFHRWTEHNHACLLWFTSLSERITIFSKPHISYKKNPFHLAKKKKRLNTQREKKMMKFLLLSYDECVTLSWLGGWFHDSSPLLEMGWRRPPLRKMH